MNSDAIGDKFSAAKRDARAMLLPRAPLTKETR